MAKRKKTTLGVVHVTATSPGTNLTMAALKRMHQARGWQDTGYNEVIFRDGRAEISGRGADGVGAHVAGFNSVSYGISLEGGVDRNNKADVRTITDAQWKTLERRMREISKQYPGIKWCGHRDLSPDKDRDGIIEPHEWLKECPTFDVVPYAVEIGVKPADIKGKWEIGAPVPGAEVVVPIGPDSRTAYLQRLLARTGFLKIAVTGIVGDDTVKAIKDFQNAQHLPATGKFDAKTVTVLRRLFEKPTMPEPAKPIVVPVDKDTGRAIAVPAVSDDEIEEVVETPSDAGKVVKSSLLGGLLGGIAMEALTGAVKGAVNSLAKDPDSPITRDKSPEIVERVVEAVVPVIVNKVAPKADRAVEQVATNASNNEPWYKSRVILGTGAAGLAIVLGFVGVELDVVEQGQIVDLVIDGVALAGAAYALYGRVFGKQLKPLGE